MSTASTSSSISTQYMSLLITQLQNQNPLDPMDNNGMTSVLTGLAELEQMESMNTNFADVLASQQAGQATSLIGKKITFASGSTTEQATVDGVTISDGTASLTAGDYDVSLDDLTAITNASE